jgi:hypothetical protein
VRWLGSTISKLLGHHFGVLLHIISVISTVPIAKSRVIAANGSVGADVEFIARRHTLSIAIHLVIVMRGAIIRVVYRGTRNSICGTCAPLKIDN